MSLAQKFRDGELGCMCAGDMHSPTVDHGAEECTNHAPKKEKAKLCYRTTFDGEGVWLDHYCNFKPGHAGKHSCVCGRRWE